MIFRTSPINENALCKTKVLLQPVESDLQQTLRLKNLDHGTSTEKRRIHGFTRPSSSSRLSSRYSSSLLPTHHKSEQTIPELQQTVAT
mmetsp:Transcript_50518/g.157736  ORF Transcript_50518/g.157736 Transcript_50518/m.157736 type:complete len:88 (-) Transcript_50518:31-294(-)